MIQVICTDNSTLPSIFPLKVYSETKNIPFVLTVSFVNSGYVLFYNICKKKFLDKKIAATLAQKGIYLKTKKVNSSVLCPMSVSYVINNLLLA